MDDRTPAFAVAALLVVAGCQRGQAPPTAEPAPEPAPIERAPAATAEAFVNKVWRVAQSPQVERGALRVFLEGGTLVMASPNAEPAFGEWRMDGDRLTIVEEGQAYPAEILALTPEAFRIRLHSPGEPVEILFEPAPAEARDALLARTQAPAGPAAASADEEPTDALLGTAWRLTSLAGRDVAGRSAPTLEFPAPGRASGSGSCNRFHGVVTVEGRAITFGGIAATRKACDEALMRREDAYFAALDDAVRFSVSGEVLEIFAAGGGEPLRFTSAGEAEAQPLASIARAPAVASTDLMGVWTVARHHEAGGPAGGSARARHGDSVRLTRSLAASAGQRCDDPRYASRRVNADDYLAREFGLAPGALPVLARRGEVQVLEVRCGGAAWDALGARLIEIDPERALAPWSGLFFELERDRDFRALGQEPGWQLELRKGAEMRFTYNYGEASAVLPAPRPEVDPGTGTETWHATGGGHDLRVVIVPVRCTDTMSGRVFAATVSVTLDGRTFRGCGETLATPYQG